MRRLLAASLGSFLAMALATPASAADYMLSVTGPTHAVPGRSLFVALSGAMADAADQGIELTVSGLPTGADFTFPDMAASCCGTKATGFWAYSTPFSSALELQIGASTPPGNYSIQISGKGKTTAAVVETTFDFVVDPVPSAPAPGPLTLPAIPQLATWETQMTTFGKKHCDEATITANGLAETNVWYYDGIRVFYQIADYAHDTSFDACAGYVRAVYRDTYVIPNNGAVGGWRVFPHGLQMDYVRTQDDVSKQAALMLYEKGSYANGPLAGIIDTSLSREVAYAINAKLVAGRLGEADPNLLEAYADIALGHIDMWFVSQNYTDRIAPFMVGLTSEALIGWYEKTGDSRVPGAIKTALDAIWATLWDAGQKAFYYEQVKGQPPSSLAPDVNLLIAPAFAWLYRQTADAKYRDAADQIFEGGVQSAWLDGGKQFNQNYRWSFDYVKWRTEPATTPDGGTGGSGGSSPSDGGTADSSAGGSAGTSAGGSTGAAGDAGTSSQGGSGIGGSGATAAKGSGSDDSGCGCSVPGSRAPAPWLLLLAGACAARRIRPRVRR